ncbi:MAG: hypothetical protein ACOC1I_03150 [Spirochaetota bacterium]
MTEVSWHDPGNRFANEPCAVTIGVFDGLHAGHQELIRRVVDSPWTPVVVTFERHPSELLVQGRVPGFIMSLPQRREVLHALGVRIAVFVDFTSEFRNTPGRRFLRDLGARFDLRRLVVGHDFRCGHRLDTDVAAIKEHFAGSSVEVLEVAPVTLESDTVSSTRIRNLILRGSIRDAERMLGRPYALDIGRERVERRAGRASLAMTQTRLLPAGGQIVPPPGSYDAVLVGTREHSVELQIGRNYLSWPLAAGDTIRYIVIKDRRFYE